MVTVLLILGTWVAVSVLLGFLFGTFVRFNEVHDSVLERPTAIPEILAGAGSKTNMGMEGLFYLEVAPISKARVE
jgi:hypothetical protein